MYSLMLVEDEPIVLEGMMKIIDFESLGFELVSACSNGLEALEAYRKFKPDVVITDICMEIMDGLEFIEEVSDDQTQTKFVIVSGHQDFKFFKRALSLKVTDYILKPVTAREFRELMKRISDELDARANESSGMEVNHFEAFVEVERNMFFNRFMHVKMAETEIKSKLDSFGIEFKERFLQTAIFKLNQPVKTALARGLKSVDELLNIIYSDLKGRIENETGTMAFLSLQGEIIVIVNKAETDLNNKVLETLIEVLRDAYRVGDMGYIDCYVGFEVESVALLPKSYKSANRLNICGVLDNGCGIYNSEALLFSRANKRLDYTVEMAEWVKLIIYGDNKSLLVLDNMFTMFFEASFLLTDFQTAVSQMQDYLFKELKILKRPLDMKLIEQIDQKNEQCLKAELNQITEDLVHQISRSSSGKDHYIAHKAVDYIEAHYADPNIDLTQVCEELNISVSYFSTIFKKHTSMTFVKYLNSFRIEKSKYFLEYSDVSISEVSEMVGFVEAHYFGIVFKKYTETTPKKYRAGHR